MPCSPTYDLHQAPAVMQVTMISRDESPGFKVSFVRDGQTLTDISVAFDGEMAVKSEWVGRGPEGFPQMEGNVTQVRGKHLIIRWGPTVLAR